MAIVLPFNFNPSSTVVQSGDSINYTVPSGKYALVKVTMLASVAYNGNERLAAQQSGAGSGACDSKVVSDEFWLTDGDVLDSTVPAEISSTVGSADSETVTVSYTINAGSAAECVAKAGYNTGGANAITASKETAARFHAVITLYDVP